MIFSGDMHSKYLIGMRNRGKKKKSMQLNCDASIQHHLVVSLLSQNIKIVKKDCFK